MTATTWIREDVPTHPIKDGAWVKIIAHLKNNETGEVRKYETSTCLDDGEPYPHAYIWEEGNYSCDCNRELFFDYAAGKQYDEIETVCSDGRFSVNLENPATGEVWYREFQG